MFDGVPDRIFSQLVKGNTLCLLRIQPEHGGKMPANRLALTVGVGRQKNLGGVFRLLFQGIDQLALSADIDVCSTSMPSLLLGRSLTCPLDETTL